MRVLAIFTTVGVAVLSIFLMVPAAQDLTSPEPVREGTSLEVLCAKEYVEGYPMLVSVRYSNKGSLAFVDSDLQSLASSHLGGFGLRFFFVSALGPSSQLQVGRSEYGSVFRDLGAYGHRKGGIGARAPEQQGLPPSTKLEPGATFSTTVDLYRLATYLDSKRSARLPDTGVWAVRASADPAPLSPEVRLAVRKPNAQEKDVKAAFETLTTPGRPWFPDVVLVDGVLPSGEGLPGSTQLVVDLIGVLRAAVRSPEDGLAELDSKADVQWGHLTSLIDAVDYECALDANQTGRAKAVRSRLGGSSVQALELKLVDDGDGLIRRFREARR